MNTIDYLIIAMVVVFALLGLYWGIIRQVLSIVGVIAGISLAGRYGSSVAEWLTSFVRNGQTADVFGFIVVFFAVTALAGFLASLLHRFAGLLFLGWADHAIGCVLGAVQGIVIAAVLISVLAANPSEAISAALRDSQYAGGVARTFGFVQAFLPESIRSSVEIFFGGL